MALTLRGDLYNPQIFSAYAGFAFVENLTALKFARLNDPTAPFVISNSGMLKQAGNFIDNPKFLPISGIVSRRDNTNTGAATVLGLTTRNDTGVRISRKIGPVGVTKNVVNQAGYSFDLLAKEIGNQGGKNFSLEVRKILIGVAKSICDAMTSTPHTKSVYVASGTKALMSSQLLAQAKYLMGDSDKLNNGSAGWLLRSESLLDMTTFQMGQGVQGIADRAAAGANPLMMGLDWAIADDPSLTATNGSNYKKYFTLAIGSGLIEVELEALTFDEPWYNGTLENPGWYFRGDVDMMITVPGFAWDKQNGGVNPDFPTLTTPAYWLPTYSDPREIPAVEIIHNTTAG